MINQIQNLIEKKIFTLDAWVIFLLIFLPYVFPDNFFGYFLTVVYLIATFVWAYFLGLNLYAKLPGGHYLNLNKFKFHLLFPAIFFTFAIIITGGGYSITTSNIEEFGPAAYIILPLHFFGFYCIFYTIYFLSKALICASTQNKNIESSDYMAYFFGFWFFPIGIWFIQPKIKALNSEHN